MVVGPGKFVRCAVAASAPLLKNGSFGVLMVAGALTVRHFVEYLQFRGQASKLTFDCARDGVPSDQFRTRNDSSRDQAIKQSSKFLMAGRESGIGPRVRLVQFLSRRRANCTHLALYGVSVQHV
jgi:hypothetical protein